MMGRQSRQMAMVFVDMASLIPENHLLRKIDGMVSFDFIYGLLAPYYSATGRPSVDPVSMFKMLLVGYLYGIKSERRLVEEIRLNIAYRWFCGFELDDAIPDHSTFSKTRTRKWQQSGLFQNAFYEIVKQCIACGLIDGKAMAADGSYIPANVSRESWIDVEIEVEQSMQSYLDSLDEEISSQPGFKKPPTRTIKKRRTTSRTDPDSGYINHGNKRGIGYLMEATVDCKHGILTGVGVYPANEKESLLVLRHLERQIKLGVPMNRLALDRGYDTGAVHRGLELLGVTGYIPEIQFPNAPGKYGFSYDPQRDAFICPEGVGLTYHRLNCNQSTGKYLRCYQIEDDACKHCVKRPSCFDKAGIRRRVLASSCYPAFYRGHQRVGTPEFLSMMRLRKIWAEGSFSVLKREHCISKIRKRGILAATEECLLAAMALNLKRMASAVFFYLHISYSAGTTAGFGSFLAFVNGSMAERKQKVSIPLTVLSVLIAVIVVFPIVWMVLSSFKPSGELFSYPLHLFSQDPTVEHYASVLAGGFMGYVKNSLFLAVVGTLITLVISSMCGYALAIYRFEIKYVNLVFGVFLLGTLIPGETLTVPQFSVISALGLYNNIWGVILPVVTTTTGIFMYRQHYMSIPLSFVEAARIDGANELQIFTRIMFPLGSSVTVTLTIFSFMWRWNDYILPLLVLSDQKKYTIQIAIKNFIGNLGVDWSSILAASVLSILPVIVIFIFLQKYIIGGISASGVKG